MNEEAKKSIEELKGIVMALHRSAGSLDVIIQSFELEENSSIEYLNVYINAQRYYRRDMRRCSYGDLEQKEDAFWILLIESFKEKES